MNALMQEPAIGIFPQKATPGALGVFTREKKIKEIKQLELKPEPRLWEVRAYLSDHVPLAGTATEILRRATHHFIKVNPSENPLWIYLHAGGRNAIYYGLFNGSSGMLEYITVKVHSRLPSNAILLARAPINALLDVLVRNYPMPLTIQRLDLMSPEFGDVLLSECLIPEPSRIVIGPLGGIMQATPFAPYDALYREALVTSSPFYRLVCAWKMYEGSGKIRARIRKECEERGKQAKLPPDPKITPEELLEFGFHADFVAGIACARDLFEKLRDTRDAISHFLIERDEGESHVYLADGGQLRHYSTSGAAMLHYSHQAMEDLRLFCTDNGIHFMKGGTILPLPQNKDQFVVRASNFGLE